jgi:Flp pilus assembly protein TadD
MNHSALIRATATALALALTITVNPVFAVDTGGNDTNVSRPAVPTLKQARADIAAKSWTAAIKKLSLIVEADPNSADAYNLLGYSFRNAGNAKRAMQAYNNALKLNPKHTGALEYQGVLFVKLGDLDKANANLAKLEAICGTSCEEYEDLAKAING